MRLLKAQGLKAEEVRKEGKSALSHGCEEAGPPVSGMNALSTTSPDSDPGLQRLIVESRERLPERPPARERAVDMSAAVAFLAAAVAMAIAFEPSRSLDPWLAISLVGSYAIASRVEFAMGSGWAVPTQLVFVPMLFLLPTETVPLLVAAALLIARLPEYLRRSVHLER